MIIRVLDQNYFVQQTLFSEEGLVQYVCTNVSEDDGRIYRIVRIPIPEVDPELVLYLADLYKVGLFHELIQYGNEKEHFHVVMDCGPAKGRILRERLDNDVISLAERLTMGDNFLKYLIVSSIPVWFAESSMDTEHILFTDALDCALIFEMEFLEHFKEADDRVMQGRLRDVLYEIFAKELDKSKLPEIYDFLEKITQGEYSDLMSLYQEYRRIELQLIGIDEASLEPRSRLWRIWEKIKALAAHSQKYFGCIVYLIAFAYLVWSIWNLMQPTKYKDIYPAIGDVTILVGDRESAESAAPVPDDSIPTAGDASIPDVTGGFGEETDAPVPADQPEETILAEAESVNE